MPNTIGRLKVRALLYTIIFLLITTLSILTSATFADGYQLLFHLKDFKDPGSLAVKLQDARCGIQTYSRTTISWRTATVRRI